ncbi:MAG: hypothetical protein AAF447_18270 [Myxococcota bacterium]
MGALLLGAVLLVLFTSGRRTDAEQRSGLDAAGAAGEEPAAGRPGAPPVKGRDEPFSLPDPTAPLDMNVVRSEAYRAAQAEGEPRPGETAFRAMVSAFMRHNHAFAEQQAEEEGLTVGEVEELTFLGMMAQQSQRWPEVEDVLGAPVEAATREQAEQFLDELNQGFKTEMRELVASGASEGERGRLIRRTQERYREGYFGLTGMSPEGLDDLLAGDGSRAYPPGELPPEEVLAQQPEAQPQPEPVRPTGDAAPRDPPEPEAPSTGGAEGREAEPNPPAAD